MKPAKDEVYQQRHTKRLYRIKRATRVHVYAIALDTNKVVQLPRSSFDTTLFQRLTARLK